MDWNIAEMFLYQGFFSKRRDRIGGRQKITLCFLAGALLYAVGAVIVY